MRESYRNYVRHDTPSFRARSPLLLEDRAPLVITALPQGSHRFACRADSALARRLPDDLIAEDYLLTTASTGVIHSQLDLPEDFRRCFASVQASFSPQASMPSAPSMAISKTISAKALGLGARERAMRQARYLRPNPSRLKAATNCLGRRFHFASRSAMTSRMPRSPAEPGDLHQFPGADGAVADFAGRQPKPAAAP